MRSNSTINTINHSSAVQHPYQELYEKTFSKVLSFLSYSSRTRKEISDRIDRYLYKEEIDPEDKEQIKDRIFRDLDTLKLIDDTAYARNYIEGVLRSGKTISERKISDFLMKKGVPREISEKVLNAFSASIEEMEEEAVKKLAEKKIKNIRDTDPQKVKQKLTSYLLGKGFPPSTVFKIVELLTAR